MRSAETSEGSERLCRMLVSVLALPEELSWMPSRSPSNGPLYPETSSMHFFSTQGIQNTIACGAPMTYTLQECLSQRCEGAWV